MKKYSLLFMSLVFVASCSLFGNPPASLPNNEGPHIVTREGIIRSKNISLETPGTHLLELTDGSSLPLESKTVVLSMYLDQRVSVEGIMENKQGTDILQVSVVSFSLENQNQNNSALLLLQYSGPWPLRFQYSSLFELVSPSSTEINFLLADKTVAVDKKDDPIILINIVKDKPADLRGWITTALEKESVTIVVGNSDGERLVNNENNDVTVYVLADNLYEIRFVAPGGKDETVVKNKFYEMLSTFQWTSQQQINGNNNTYLPANENTNTHPQQSNLNTNVSPNYTGEVSMDDISSTDVKKQVISYIAQNLKNIVPVDEAVMGTVSSTKYEFATPNYVYVEYTDGINRRKLLLKYVQDSGSIQVTQIAYFIPGETKDWDLKTGSNEAATSGREVYNSSGEKTADVQEGMRLYENKTLKYGIQYPGNWYYAGSSPTDTRAIHQINFGTKPLDSNPANISVIVFKGTLTSLGITDTSDTSNGNYSIYIEKNGRVYKITGALDQQSTIDKMSQTIVTTL